MNKLFLITLISVIAIYVYVAGHGTILDPVSRASRWRFDSRAKPDYDDTQGFCGGFNVRINLVKCFLGFFNWKYPLWVCELMFYEIFSGASHLFITVLTSQHSRELVNPFKKLNKP